MVMKSRCSPHKDVEGYLQREADADRKQKQKKKKKSFTPDDVISFYLHGFGKKASCFL